MCLWLAAQSSLALGTELKRGGCPELGTLMTQPCAPDKSQAPETPGPARAAWILGGDSQEGRRGGRGHQLCPRRPTPTSVQPISHTQG